MKRVCICIVLLTAFFTASAQSKASLGIKAGANFSTWTGPEMLGVDIRTSYHAGVFGRVPVNNHFQLQPEILFSNEGTTIPEVDVVIQYIKIPLLFRYQHTSGFHAEAGPQLGFRVKATMVYDNAPKEDAKNVINPMETSLATGLGFQWSPNWDISLRYNAGISLVGEGDGKIRNNTIGISLAYQFNR
jgi:hypothetical protein